jgi:hypothetical protein
MNFRMPVAFAVLVVLAAGCGPGKISVTRGAKTLTLYEPEATTVKQGETANVQVKIAREGMTDPVSVRFEGLPPGVTTDNSTTFNSGTDSISMAFHATPGAPAVSNQEVKVIAECSGGLSTKLTMKLSVKAK